MAELVIKARGVSFALQGARTVRAALLRSGLWASLGNLPHVGYNAFGCRASETLGLRQEVGLTREGGKDGAALE